MELNTGSVGGSAVMALLALWVGAGSVRPAQATIPAGQNVTTDAAVVKTAYKLLQSHQLEGERWGMPYHFYRPANTKYSNSQWLWDSGSHQIVWSRRNVSNAVLDLRTMLQMQEPSGFVPEMIFWNSTMPGGSTRYRDGRTTGITQMPVLAFSLRSMVGAAPKKNSAAVLAEFVPPLVRYWRWWGVERDVRGKGLVSIIHGWESGLDASPLYDAAFGLKHPGPVSMALYLRLYPKFDELIASYAKLYHWNRTKILGRAAAPPSNGVIDSWLFVEDVGVNAVYIRGWEVLGDLAAEMGDASLQAECSAAAATLTAALLRECWDVDLGRFVSWWRQPSGVWTTSSVEAVQSLFPLMLGLPASHRDALVGHLTNRSKFWAPFPVPTVAMDDPTFTAAYTEAADLMWRGPSWAFSNWFIVEGLLRHAEEAASLKPIADELVRRWARAVRTDGIWEMWDPLTAKGAGVSGLGMSTLIVDALARVNASTYPH